MKVKDIALWFAGTLLAVSCQRTYVNGLAVVIDPVSYEQAQAEIDRYLEVVESRGLHPFLVIDRWGVPDSIVLQLRRLFKGNRYQRQHKRFNYSWQI